jgi:hypothetical protein
LEGLLQLGQLAVLQVEVLWLELVELCCLLAGLLQNLDFQRLMQVGVVCKTDEVGSSGPSFISPRPPVINYLIVVPVWVIFFNSSIKIIFRIYITPLFLKLKSLFWKITFDSLKLTFRMVGFKFVDVHN